MSVRVAFLTELLENAEEVPITDVSTVEGVIDHFRGYQIDPVYVILDSESMPRLAGPDSPLFENETLIVIEPGQG